MRCYPLPVPQKIAIAYVGNITIAEYVLGGYSIGTVNFKLSIIADYL